MKMEGIDKILIISICVGVGVTSLFVWDVNESYKINTRCDDNLPNTYHYIDRTSSMDRINSTCVYENQSWHRCTKTFSGDKLVEDTCGGAES